MYVIEKCDGSRTYIDYNNNRRFNIFEDAKDCLLKIFKEQEELGNNPEWVKKKEIFKYDFGNKKILAYVAEARWRK